VSSNKPAMSIAELIAREREQQRRSVAGFEAGITYDPWSVAISAVGIGLADEVPPIVYRAWQSGRLTGETLSEAIWAAWFHNKDPMRSIGQRAWVRLFKAAGFISAGYEKSENAYELHWDQPTEPVTVWRGAALDRGRGMSWTLHRGCAADFAEAAARLGFDAGVFRAVVPPRAVLACFGDEREQEIVVNPHMLIHRIELAETIPARELPGVS
jgi:hypothetical protein